MKVLVTGAAGQLGHCLQQAQPSELRGCEITLIPVTREHADLRDSAAVLTLLKQHQPDIIINAAAYTAVDKAETDVENAKQVNADFVKILVDWCETSGAHLVQVSTDFVFDGITAAAYSPASPTNPLGVYGATKLQGEQHVLASVCRAHIVRTGWVYAEQGANFVKTILRLAREREMLQIVADQMGTPTYARHLAEMIWQLLEINPSEKVWHFSDAGTASWYDFAVAIVEESSVTGLLKKNITVNPITTNNYPTPAKRPAFSVLDKTQTWQQLAITPIHWRAALRTMLVRLSEQDKK